MFDSLYESSTLNEKLGANSYFCSLGYFFSMVGT